MKEENEFLYAILKTKNNIIKINKFPFSIGRAKNNDLCLVHKSISKQHAMFQMANYENEQSIILVDLNSLNGVYVNGSKIVNDSKIAVNTGDKIKFGNQPDIYIFEKMNDNSNISVNVSNDATVLYPSVKQNDDIINKVSLVDDTLYQHSKINHFDVMPNSGTGSNFNYKNEEVIEEVNKDELMLFTRIKNELIPNWSEMSFEVLSETIDKLLVIWKQKLQINDMINSLHNQYNAEIKNFNFILSQYDNKIKENYEVINSIYRSNINSVQREESLAFLMKQLNDLVNEKQENIITINELKANIIKLQTEIKLLNYNKSITKPTKNIPDKESKEIISQLNKKIDELMPQLTSNYNNLETNIKNVHDYIINNARYDSARSDNNVLTYKSDTAYGPLFQGYAICGGYTDLMQLFLERLNVKNFRVSSDNHIWNVLYINNTWKHLDLTWDDPVASDGKDYLEYNYFLIDTNQLLTLEQTQHNFNLEHYTELKNT